MKPGPAAASKVILQSTDLAAGPRPLVEILTALAINHAWAPSLAEAREKAEEWHDATLNRLRQEVGRMAQMGRPVKIEFNSSSEYLIQGACFIEPRDSDEAKQSKLKRLNSSQYFVSFADLSADDLEVLCGRLLELMGVDEPVVTRRAADEGIDFYGRLELDSVFFPHDLMPTIQRQLKVWLVGQAKRYIRIQSGTEEIRELVGALTLARAKAFGSKTPPYQDLEIRIGDPAFALLVTTGSISANAWRLIERSGVIGMDGEMLAAFLADRGVALRNGEFDPKLFSEWLAAAT